MRLFLLVVFCTISLSAAADDSELTKQRAVPASLCVGVSTSDLTTASTGTQKAAEIACAPGAKVYLAAYGDRGTGACGGYCNDIRPESRTQCKSTQRPMYNEKGWCLCGYFDECK